VMARGADRGADDGMVGYSKIAMLFDSV